MARMQTVVLLSLALCSCSTFQRVAAEEVPDFAKTTLSGDWGNGAPAHQAMNRPGSVAR